MNNTDTPAKDEIKRLRELIIANKYLDEGIEAAKAKINELEMKSDDRPIHEVIQASREMQERGQYINGEIFHRLANEVERQQDEIKRLREENQRLQRISHEIAQELNRYKPQSKLAK